MSMKIKNVDKEFERLKALIQKAESNNVVIESQAMRQELHEETPKDTGLASNSWEISYKRDEKGNIISSVIENTVPYIEHLNSGSSKQAPAFFVEGVALKHGKAVGAIVKTTKS